MARVVPVEICIGGQPVSSAFLPRLVKLTVTLNGGGTSDTAEVEIDDDESILFPTEGDPASIKIDGIEVFRGKITEVESDGSRGDGAPGALSISADGLDSKGKAKQPQKQHFDNKTVKEMLDAAGKAAGVSDIKVDPSLASIKFTYEAMDEESFMALGQRLAEKIGGTFSISDGRAVMAKRSSGTSASGKPITKVEAVRGRNLISWRIKPFAGRQRFKKIKQRHYDPKAGKWTVQSVEVKDEKAVAEQSARFPAADESDAKRRAGAEKTKAEREKGGGTIVIDGNAAAFPEAPVALIGARPGVDGDYKVASVTHSIERGGGFTTSIEVKHPSGAAGTDPRRKPSSSGSGAESSVAAQQGAAINTDRFATP